MLTALPSRFVLRRFVWQVSECPQESRPVKAPKVLCTNKHRGLNEVCGREILQIHAITPFFRRRNLTDEFHFFQFRFRDRAHGIFQLGVFDRQFRKL
jgi:hypothetical protein